MHTFIERNSDFSKIKEQNDNHIIAIDITDNALKELSSYSISSLELRNCAKGISSEGLGYLRNIKELRELYISNCHLLTNDDLCELGTLTQLRKLNLERCKRVAPQGFKALESLTELTELKVSGLTDSKESLASIGTLTNLAKLVIVFEKPAKAGQEHLANLTKLESLFLLGPCALSTKTGTFLQSLTHLQTLQVQIYSDTVLKSVANLPVLTDLNISHSSNLSDKGISFLTNSHKLKNIDISYSSKLTSESIKLLLSIPTIERIANRPLGEPISLPKEVIDMQLTTKTLRAIEIAGGELTAERIKNLSKLSKLRSLKITGSCHSDLSPLTNLKELSILKIHESKISTNIINFITSCKSLEYLSLFDSGSIPVNFISQLPKNLQVLDLTCTTAESKILHSLPVSLKQLSLRETTFTDSIQLDNLPPNLEHLDLSFQKIIDNDLSPVSGYTTLRRLDLVGCERVTFKALDYFHTLVNLEELTTGRCDFITAGDMKKLRKILPYCNIARYLPHTIKEEYL